MYVSEFEQTSRSYDRGGERRNATRRRRRKRGMGTAGKVIGTIFLVGVTTALLLVCFATLYLNTVIIPEAKEWAQGFGGDISVSLTSTMYYTDENGVNQPYLTLDNAENRMWVKYEDLEKTDLVKALIAIEDKRFYQHNGVDWIRTAKGMLNMFSGGSIQGGSTLTQQFIKNTTGENQTTVKRKITEIFRALEFEKRNTKERILEFYLNEIYLGERCYGVGAASWVYFGKDVKELSLAQCASLVGITNNPSRYDPYLNKGSEDPNDAANRRRAKLVLKNMLEQGMIDQATHDATCEEVDALEFVTGSPEGGGPTTVYNWYQDQVIDDVIDDLMEEFDWSRQAASNKVYYGGLSIYTNVDLRVQGIVDEIYSDRANLDYVSNSGQPMQSGIVIIDHQGKVVALSGGIGEKTKNRAWSRASDSRRPSGSSIKPLSVYAPALEMGLITPNSVVDDVPYQIDGGAPWPLNAIRSYKGLDTISHAVANSTNAVAVRVLGDYVTPEKSYEFLEKRFHISSLVREQWINDHKYSDMGLAPLALGGQTTGVSPYEMAAAFAAFPSMGRYVPPRTYSKVVDAEGKVLLDRTGDGEYILKESTAFYMNNLLRGVVTSGTGTNAGFPGMTVAGKTGTTTSKKDLWFVGYTPYYTAAVWTGYDRQERLSGTPHTTLWRKVMSRVHEGLENKDFPRSSDGQVITAAYCLDSGLAPSELCSLDARGSRVATGVYISGDQPTQTCTVHTELSVCTADPILDAEGNPTGRYRVAGPNCPEETVTRIGVLNHVREGAAAMGNPADAGALLSSYDREDTCHAHGAGWTPHPGGAFDPADPSTWPTDDPNFNIHDPNTWPQTSTPGGEETPTSSAQPGVEPTTSEHPVQGPPDNEPYIPAGIPMG